MDPTTQAFLSALLGAVLGAGVVLAWRVSEIQQRGLPAPPTPTVPTGVATVLSVLRSSALVVDQEDFVLKASAPAYGFGLVRDGRLQVDELAELVRHVRRDGKIRETELTLEKGQGQRFVTARVAPLGTRLVLVLVEDRTRERRVEAVRRDFVANVSHELKTPVGALNVLAEAVDEAAEDPGAVKRFAARMRFESERLSELVQQIIELSRLQADDPLDAPMPVGIDEVAEAAIKATAIEADTHHVEVMYAGEHGLEVLGNATQISVALGNLVANAVAYSPPASRVVVAAKPAGAMVEITVRDQGIGIPASELDRIFERFYRVDPARHRSTGGTGLGLAIVKHIVASHGGDVRVWSVEGHGSTFTMSLPAAVSADSAPNLPQDPVEVRPPSEEAYR